MTTRRVLRAIVTISEAMPWVLLPLVALVILTAHASAPAPTHVVFGPTPTANVRQIVLCHSYLSHAAMVAAAQTHIPAAPSFCVITGR